MRDQPDGPVDLPTPEELQAIIHRARMERSEAIRKVLVLLFSGTRSSGRPAGAPVLKPIHNC
jgi:hypothetical protein